MNNSFSKHNDRLQIAWDASALKSLQFCPRSYQYGNLEGWRTSSVDLDFGRLIAEGFERFKKSRLDGATTDEALLQVVRWALEATYYEATECVQGCHEEQTCGSDPCHMQDTQWGGRYESLWHCKGDKPYKNAKGNRAKCPNSHAGVFFPGDAPDICVECHGGTIETVRMYVPDSPNKNRQSLLRTLVWYGLSQPEDIRDGYRPYVFPDGTQAVELSGRLPLPWRNSYGEQYILSWNFDYIGEFGVEHFITDNKTTKKTLDSSFFNAYSPDTQFDTYAMVGPIAYPDLNIKGVMLEGVQILVGSSAFGMHPYYKTEEQNEEHFYDMKVWIDQAERYALTGYWPMNKRNCWLCPFKGVCSLDPRDRQGALEANFKRQPRWDPLHER